MLPTLNLAPEVFEDFIQAAANQGFPKSDDFNGADQEGVGYYQVTQKDGKRCSVAKGFITPNMERPNLTVMTEVMVNKLIMKDKVVTSVQLKQKGEDKQIFCQQRSHCQCWCI